MKVQEKGNPFSVLNKNNGAIMNVFAIYWSDCKIHFACMEKNYDGLLIHYPDEIIILDPSISFKIIFYASEDGRFLGLFHWSLVEKNLWDGVIDGELADRQEFLRIIRSENLIDW